MHVSKVCAALHAFLLHVPRLQILLTTDAHPQMPTPVARTLHHEAIATAVGGTVWIVSDEASPCCAADATPEGVIPTLRVTAGGPAAGWKVLVDCDGGAASPSATEDGCGRGEAGAGRIEGRGAAGSDLSSFSMARAGNDESNGL